MSARWRVAAWTAVAALLAWLTVASLIDRLAGEGVLIDAPSALRFGGDVLAVRADRAWEAGDLAGADRLARAAVARRPIDAAVLRVAGSIALARGEGSRGEALMRLAGAGGWRDVPTQLYWAQAALEQGAFDTAAERLDAIGRAAPDPRARALLRRLEGSAPGRAALLARLRAGNEWAITYLADVDGLDAAGLTARVALVDALGPDRATRDRVAAALIEAGQGALAWRVAGRGQRLIAPFRSPDEVPGPFDWRFDGAAGLDASARGGVLTIRASGPTLVAVADQLVRLPAGHARLAGRVAGARTPLPLMVGLSCLAGGEAKAEADAAPAGWFAARLFVPPNCPMQRLTLAVAGEEARRGADLTVSGMTVTAAAAP